MRKVLVLSRSTWCLLAILVLTILLRLPPILRQPGGMDEYWFAVPGWTVAQEGIPRVPYTPERNLSSYFWKADQMLFALPPGYFYWQAPLYWLISPGYPVARIASLMASLLSLVLLYGIGVRLAGSRAAALWGVLLYSISRVFFFPAITARPDALCGMFGLVATWFLANVISHQTQSLNRSTSLQFTFAGLFLGLAGLTHPFAMAIALPLYVWVLIQPKPWEFKWKGLALVTTAGLLTLLLWLPLIWQHPDIFKHQFFGNVLNRAATVSTAGGGFFASLGLQAKLFVEHAGPIQAAMILVVPIILLGIRESTRTKQIGRLAILSIVFLVVMQGSHPTKGYWCYPGALSFLAAGVVLCNLARSFGQSASLICVVFALSIALMVPGLGARATWGHLAAWNEPDAHPQHFIKRVLEGFSKDEKLLVDPTYVFDAYLLGYDTTLAMDVDIYFQATAFTYDYLIISQYGLDNNLPEKLSGAFMSRRGEPNNTYRNFVEIYKQKVVTEP